MSEITTYRFAIGGREQLREGGLDLLNVSDDYSILMERLLKNEAGLAVPKFIGVYQEVSLILSPRAEPFSEAINFSFEKDKCRAYNFARSCLAAHCGLKDAVYPTMISMIYNSDLMTASLAKLCLGDEVGRIAIIPHEMIPNFHEKDISLFQHPNDDFKSFADEAIPSISLMEDQERTFGLTRVERAIPSR